MSARNRTMPKFVCSTISSGLCLLALLSLPQAGMAVALPDEIQVHGFLAQSLFHTSDNNLFGQSDDGISLGITEIGLNASYQAHERLSFAIQGLYRRAGDIDRGSVRVDYGLADLTLWEHEAGRIGIRGGRVKVPLGLYNETRDVAFTHPTILLPQGNYFERSRSLLTSGDGGQFYAEHRTDYGDFNFKFNYVVPLGNNQEIRSILLGPFARGEFSAKPTVVTQLSYELNGGEYVFAVSYADLELVYHPLAGDIFGAGHSFVRPLMLSAQYNGEKLTLTAEYNYRHNVTEGYGSLPDRRFATESWYIEGSYRFLPKWQVTLRYDTIDANTDNRNGAGFERIGLPHHAAFAQDWTLGLRWDINQSWMVRGEYHRVHGTMWLPQADNPDRLHTTAQDWDLFGVQISFRF
jgi:predicted porin